ncbi:hypothetical protein J4Q44_G00121010, partial [Coregonus suidteri]
VDNSFIVGSKEADGVFEEQHEGAVDDAIGQFIRVSLGREQIKRQHIESSCRQLTVIM